MTQGPGARSGVPGPNSESRHRSADRAPAERWTWDVATSLDSDMDWCAQHHDTGREATPSTPTCRCGRSIRTGPIAVTIQREPLTRLPTQGANSYASTTV